MKNVGIYLWFLLPLAVVQANEVEVVRTEFSQHGGTWNVSTTLRHKDAGWEHYADEWRVVDAAGKILGRRVLVHPHEHEQPFTRNQGGIAIPANTTVVFVEAHDKVHGWGAHRVRVDLTRASGERFTVRHQGE